MPRMMEHLEEYLAKIGKAGGKKGGKSKSKAKRAAAIKNAAKARAARTNPCAGYKSHRFNPKTGQCYSPECRKKYPDVRMPKPPGEGK